ncbi:MAG: SMC family ATPase [Candidatus Wallbacteria bacterium]
MRPLKLTIEAFGPYLKKQVIDFSELKGRNFFLIHGPTGSGKTTILDAICYALYGKTSGDERDGAKMRSSKAQPDVPTSVTLDFKTGDKIYRITRMPKQEITAKRGSKLKTQNPQALLMDITGGHNIDNIGDAGTVIAEKTEKANEIIEDIIGFKYEQFRQVVMLPQGKFQQFLAASSKEREAILEVLFQTNYYKQIETALKEETAEIQSKISDERAEINFILNNFNVSNFNELCDMMNKLAAESETASAKMAELKTADLQISNTVKNAEILCSKFDKLTEINETLNKLKSRESEINELKRLLDMAKKAEPILHIEETFETYLKREKEISSTMAVFQKKLELSKINLENAFQNYNSARLKLSGKSGLEIKINGLQNNLTDLDRLLKISAKKKELEIKSSSLKAELASISGRLETAQKSIDETVRALSDAQNKTALLPAFEKSYQNAEHVYKDVLKLNELKKEALERFRIYSEEADTENDALKALNDARAKLNELEKTFNENQAAAIAETLKSGTPCPVCGSLDHPRPASRKNDGIDKKAIDKQKKFITECEAKLDEARNKKNAAEIKKVEIEAAAANLSESLKESAGLDMIVLKAACDREKQLLKDAEAANKNVKALESSLNSLNAKKTADAELIEKKREEIASIDSELFGSGAVIEELKNKVPAEFQDQKALSEAINGLKAEAASIDNEFKTAEEKYNQTNAENIKLSADLKNAAANLEIAQKDKNFHFEKLNKAIIENGFGSREDYDGYKRYIPQINSFEADIKNFNNEQNIACSSKNTLEAELKDAVKPDLAVLKKQAEEIKNNLYAAVKEATLLNSRLQNISSSIKKINEISAATEELNKRYQLAAALSETAGGVNRYNMTFQRFVQGAFLEEVLTAATHRLKIMSRGRYHLNRSAGVTDMRSSGGLELEVLDNYTGIARAVSTLSGGETFMASLSLALGLADTVQNYSGGIKLDTIFIDEGFGSLDPESLDLAINVLTELFKGGRLVAIISHVPELRERIDARLEVSVINNGESRAKFITL